MLPQAVLITGSTIAQGVDDDELCDALESLEIQSVGKSKEPLRGLPVPQV